VSNSFVPGMQRTTNYKGVKTSGEGAASFITPAATGRDYPAFGELLIGVGDRLHISVYETPEFAELVEAKSAPPYDREPCPPVHSPGGIGAGLVVALPDVITHLSSRSSRWACRIRRL